MANHTFRDLHTGRTLLLLPNAWDAGSAAVFESLGAPAIATTSAGLAWARGYPDGDELPVGHLFAVAREIARVIRVPLTIDIEGGYSDDPARVGQTVAGVIDAGAVGINIEDGVSAPDLLCAKIEAAREAAMRARVDLFVNVRTDVYLRAVASGAAAVEAVVSRAQRYQAAGCDGLFVPGLADGAEIGAIAAAVDPLPLNIMLLPALPSFDILHAQGVRRLSAGSAIAQAVLGHARRLAAGFLAGTTDQIFDAAADYGATNALFARAPHAGQVA